MYAVGDNSHGQLGVGAQDFDGRMQYTKTKVVSRVAMVSTEAHTTLALTEDGAVFAWGANRWDLEHLKAHTGRSALPVALTGVPPFTERITAVGAGNQDSIAITGTPRLHTYSLASTPAVVCDTAWGGCGAAAESGQLWSWGPQKGIVRLPCSGVPITLSSGARHSAVVVDVKSDSARGAAASDESKHGDA